MNRSLKIHDVVALKEDCPLRQLSRGHTGTIVDQTSPNLFEVEFADDTGRTLQLFTLHADQLVPTSRPTLFEVEAIDEYGNKKLELYSLADS